MTKIITLSNQKRGVSKTKTVVNYGIRLVKEGKRGTLVDTDFTSEFNRFFGYSEPYSIPILVLPSFSKS